MCTVTQDTHLRTGVSKNSLGYKCNSVWHWFTSFIFVPIQTNIEKYVG